MAIHNFLPGLLITLLATLVAIVFSSDDSTNSQNMYPFTCSDSEDIRICNASLYHTNYDGLKKEQLASIYGVSPSQIISISSASRQDYLVTVPCSCKNISGTIGYFYDAIHNVSQGEMFFNVSAQIFNGQAWWVEDEARLFNPGYNFSMHLLCGCTRIKSQIVVTYTVQLHDTLSDISSRLSSTVGGIQSMNINLIKNPSSINVDWVLFVPMGSIPASRKGSGGRKTWIIIISILSALTALSIITLVILLLRRNGCRQNSEEDSKPVSKSMSTNRAFSLQNLYKESNEDGTAFESEKPVIFSIEEIEEATKNFDKTKKIGEGGYGCVYHGLLRGQEVAVKKMRSNKSHEFFAELKVLCKIHHINVVELLGYAGGDDHFYLTYEYVRNGSLSDHLHDPFLKDFGLAKLVERTSDEDLIATRLVGTPGYLPPESVKELQVTSKTDVFAFGVVLAELITGQRAISRDNGESNKMKSLITVVYKIFEDQDPETALADVIDKNLRNSYPMEDVYKMAEIADWCLSEEATNRPEMREVVQKLSMIVMSSVEWEASLGGSSQIFSGVFNGR
ncbi:hypothetical protein SADUNF_Sadunf08G0153700 [Salix dunnii]|uniref:Protein kinase domain-containing protein n=1 Tax=Salix dunnii TaxID=1413687 RepID=A0A835JUT7_9ROSI|nr:hypothetical protein SADUNF_Sadunf08G0153700 [Salix dunnii]